MAVNSAWANRRILAAVERLGEEALQVRTPSYFGSLSATLNHVLTVDWFYVDALERALRGEPPHERPSSFFDPEVPHPGLAPLRAAQEEVDRRLMELCSGLTPSALDTPVRIRRRGGESRDSVTRLLAHLFQHQIHHRGQAHQLISALSARDGGARDDTTAADPTSQSAPPQLDEFFCVGDAPGRADELAALGLSEREVFGES